MNLTKLPLNQREYQQDAFNIALRVARTLPHPQVRPIIGLEIICLTYLSKLWHPPGRASLPILPRRHHRLPRPHPPELLDSASSAFSHVLLDADHPPITLSLDFSLDFSDGTIQHLRSPTARKPHLGPLAPGYHVSGWRVEFDRRGTGHDSDHEGSRATRKGRGKGT